MIYNLVIWHEYWRHSSYRASSYQYRPCPSPISQLATLPWSQHELSNEHWAFHVEQAKSHQYLCLCVNGCERWMWPLFLLSWILTVKAELWEGLILSNANSTCTFCTNSDIQLKNYGIYCMRPEIFSKCSNLHVTTSARRSRSIQHVARCILRGASRKYIYNLISSKRW